MLQLAAPRLLSKHARRCQLIKSRCPYFIAMPLRRDVGDKPLLHGMPTLGRH